MATRQYIGARYVPKFSDVNSGDWDNSYSYEALTIVKHGVDYYTSRIPVPAGIDIGNTLYWVKTGDYNGAIIDLNDKVDSLLKNNPEAGTAVILGNSFVDRGCADYFMDKFNDAKAYTLPSIGFAPYTGVTQTYSDALTNAINDATLDASKVTSILIATGFGECIAYQENAATFEANMISCINDIKTRAAAAFPNLQEICVAYGATRCVHQLASNRWQMLWLVHSAFSRLLPANQIRYLGWTGWFILMDSTMFESDNIHPNMAGADIMARALWSGYKGTLQYPTYQEYDTIPMNDFPSGSEVNVAVAITPTGGQITLRAANLKAGNVAYGTHNVLDLSSFKYMPVTRYNLMESNCPLVYDSSGNSVRGELTMGVQGGVFNYNTIIQFKVYANVTIPADYNDAGWWQGRCYLFD